MQWHGRITSQKPMDTGRKRTWARQKGEGLRPSNGQSKEEVERRKCKPKDPCIFHITRVKQLPELIVELEKRGGYGKCVKVRKVMDLDRSGAYKQGPGTTYLYPTNIGEVGYGSRVCEGVVRW